MNIDRIKEIQQETAYPESVSVQQALLKVWNECEQEQLRIAGVNKRLLFSACLQGKRDQIYWPTKWEDYEPIGKYRVMKKFLKWYSTVC